MTFMLLPDSPHDAETITRLRNDVDAQRRALERVTAERDHWRAEYHELAARVQRLLRTEDELARLRREGAA